MIPERKSRWLLAFRRDAIAARRVFCFPYAGGGASVYRRLAEQVAPGTEVCAVQLPGREDRYSEPGYVSMAALAPMIVTGIRPFLAEPFVLFGHSMGAVIAFEVARELRRIGAPRPLRLVVSGRRAPHLAGRRRPLHALPDAELDAELRELQGTPREVLDNPELMELVRPTLRADFELIETYAHAVEAPLDVPFTILGGTGDPDASGEELAGWEEHTSAGARVRMFAGHHFYLHECWPAIAEEIGAGFRPAAPPT